MSRPDEFLEVVRCDFCSADYTESAESGGFVSGSWAACPRCVATNQVVRTDHDVPCPPSMSFADFVRRTNAGLATEARSGTVPVRLLGLPTVCWRCGQTTMALAGLLPADGADEYDVITCQAEAVLQIAAAALPAPARRRFAVGAVKPRYSRRAGGRYLSNGCFSCDALLGAYPLYAEELPAALAEEGLAGLVTLAEVQISSDDYLLALHESR